MPVAVSNRVGTCDRSFNLPITQTPDATPAPRVVYSVPRDTTVRLGLVLMARAADGRSKTWAVTRTGKNVDGVLSLVGSPPTPTIEADAGTSSWTAALSVAGEDVVMTVTGENGVTITWALLLDYLLVSTAA